jgi:hypothetical protein
MFPNFIEYSQHKNADFNEIRNLHDVLVILYYGPWFDKNNRIKSYNSCIWEVHGTNTDENYIRPIIFSAYGRKKIQQDPCSSFGDETFGLTY